MCHQVQLVTNTLRKLHDFRGLDPIPDTHRSMVTDETGGGGDDAGTYGVRGQTVRV